MIEKLPRFRFITGFVLGSLLVGVGAVAVNVNNTPEGGYLICANKKTRNVTFPGSLKCPSGTIPIEIPGSNNINYESSEELQASSSSTAPKKSNDGKGNTNCNLNYLQKNPNQISTVVPECSSSQLSKLQTELNSSERESQARLEIEQKKAQDLKKEAEAKKGTAGALAAAEALDKQTALVAELIANTKNNIQILTEIVKAIAKKVSG